MGGNKNLKSVRYQINNTIKEKSKTNMAEAYYANEKC